jgi:hypothetical protein
VHTKPTPECPTFSLIGAGEGKQKQQPGFQGGSTTLQRGELSVIAVMALAMEAWKPRAPFKDAMLT